MIDFGQYLGQSSSLVQAQREMRSWVQFNRLNDKPTTVVLKREGSYLPAQTVRIEFDNTDAAEASSDAGSGFARNGILFGLKDHPTLPDLDIDVWDTFILGNEEFTIMAVNKTLFGQIQCQFEAVGA